MGSRRIGLGRIETLFENLKRELAMDGASLTGLAQSRLATQHTTAGANLADDTATVNFVRADHGKRFVCLLDGAAKTLNLPTNMLAADVGVQIEIIQGADLVASGVLTINANTGNTFCTNSFALGYGTSRVLAPTRPADANNRIVITGAGTNSAWGIGSRAIFTCVAAGEWYFEITAEPLGTGKDDAIAFSTV